MKTTRLALFVTAILIAFVKAHSQTKYETVVEGSRFNSTSKIILNAEEIQKSKASNLTTLLQTQANLSIVSTPLQPNTIFLRGGDSSHLLILVDGLPFYDPSTIQKTLNLNDLDIRKIKKIEILKGSQSVLYGGQALTGVIKIETFPSEVSDDLSLTTEAGQQNYQRVSAEGIKALSDVDALVVRGQAQQKASRSPILNSGVNYKNQNASGDVGYLYRKDFTAFAKASQIWGRSEFPMQIGASALQDAEDNVYANSFKSAMAGFRFHKSPLKPQLWVGHQNSHRSYNGIETDYFGDLTTARLETVPVDQESLHLIAGLSYTAEGFRESKASIEQSKGISEATGAFLKLTKTFSPDWELELGYRKDFVLYKDSVDSYQLGLNFLENYRFEFATGFKIPSLFQQYSSGYGGAGQGLQPEKSKTFSLTYDRQISDQQRFSLALFETRFDDLIQYVGNPPTGRFVNKTALTRGVESRYTLRTENRWRFDLSAGYQEPWDVSEARWLNRRPLQTGNVRILKSWEKSEAGYEIVGNGERRDGNNTVSSFVISNVFYSQKLAENMNGYIRANNIFNNRYQQTFGYYDEGAFWYAGLDMNF